MEAPRFSVVKQDAQQDGALALAMAKATTARNRFPLA